MTDYTTVRTATLRTIISATSFADAEARARIDELIQLEEMLLWPERLGFAGSMRLRQLRDAHPVVTLQLEAELHDGTILEPDQVAYAEREHRFRVTDLARRERDHVEREARAREALARRTWLAVGGRA